MPSLGLSGKPNKCPQPDNELPTVPWTCGCDVPAFGLQSIVLSNYMGHKMPGGAWNHICCCGKDRDVMRWQIMLEGSHD